MGVRHYTEYNAYVKEQRVRKNRAGRMRPIGVVNARGRLLCRRGSMKLRRWRGNERRGRNKDGRVRAAAKGWWATDRRWEND